MDASPSSSSITLHDIQYIYPSSLLHPTLMSSDLQLFNPSSAPHYDLSSSQGFYDGGDVPLLTSSWEALDKLVSASMAGCSSPSLSDLDQKPLSSFYNSPSSTSTMAMSGCQLHMHDNHRPQNINVGLNQLASLLSADPSFVDRAAKLSSYSQQRNPVYNGHISSSSVKSSHNINHVVMDSHGAPAGCKTSNMNAAHPAANSAAYTAAPQSFAVSKTELDAVVNAETQKDKSGRSPQGSMASRRKRSVSSSPEDSVEKEDGVKLSSHYAAAKKAKKGQVHSVNSISANESDRAKENSKLEPPAKLADFVHVRARRGQATDSHSLAERVRREKISERMKYLQDLVPGCTKVTGKAMVLDEIINYVQSLQRQVEFLSMKLASVPHSKVEFNFERLFAKQVTKVEQHLMSQHMKQSRDLFTEDRAAQELYNSSVEQLDAPHSYQLLLQDHDQHQLPLQSNTAINPKLAPTGPVNPMNPSLPHCFMSDPSDMRRALLHNILAATAATSSDTLGECISQITDVWDDDLPTMDGASGL